jgi:hypothetical protein
MDFSPVHLGKVRIHSFKSKRGKGGYMFLKMDMEKAFDRME